MIEAFSYLETRKILHRDIRETNILVDVNGVPKIIDFGFGKKLESLSTAQNSIFLNWPVKTLPKEIVEDGVYNHKTEMFFLGKLLCEIPSLKSSSDFIYRHILEKMVSPNPSDRYDSFADVLLNISSREFINLKYTRETKNIYQEFASSLVDSISSFNDDLIMERDHYKLIMSLGEAIRTSSLEDFFQKSSIIINCFIKQGYTYYNYPKSKISVETARKFYELFTKIDERDRQVFLDNLEVRFGKIKVKKSDPFDVPF